MCKEGLRDKKSTNKWLLTHHPDQGGKTTSTDVGAVATCMKERSFCTRKNNRKIPSLKVQSRKHNNDRSSRSSRSNRNSGSSGSIRNSRSNSNNDNVINSINRVFKRIHVSRDKVPEGTVSYKPSEKQLACVRQVSNWSKITPSNRFNKSRFDIKATDKLIPIASPKLEALLQNITALDANDMMLYGKKFKHFIFSDIKFLGYGAKIISAGFIARGFRPVLKFEKSRIVVDVPKGDGNNFAVLSSTALWDSPFKHKLKKEVLDLYNKRPDNVHGEKCRFIILDSGFKEGIDLFDVRYVHLFEPLMTEADMTQALGRATRLCGQKGLDFVPNKGWPLNVYKYSQNIPEQLQGKFKAQNLTEITLQLKGLDSRLHNISKAIKDVSILAAVDQPLTEEIHKSGLMPRLKVVGAAAAAAAAATTSVKTVRSLPFSMELKTNSKDMSDVLTRKNLANDLALEDTLSPPETRDPCDDCFSAALVPFKPNRLSSEVVTPKIVLESNTLVVYDNKGTDAAIGARAVGGKWYDLRHSIMQKFGKMAWSKQEIVNKCIDKKVPEAATAAAAKKDYIVPPQRKDLPHFKLVDYTPTQEFISKYFTVKSAMKGMLLWHSVGTGKTCSAIALASSQFEPAGYSIIWVTRHTLKADIWKNIFDQVCHKTIAKEIKDGSLVPEDAEKRKKQLAQQWIPPMSYRQFSNLVQGKNPLYEVLKQRNGKADPLKKTLIIIDEAHKLYSSDFKGAEKPDVPAFNAALQNSYKVSNKDSARVLLMTATPYNESPMELMSLLNLCRVKADWLPTEIVDFVEKYMDGSGKFTKEGLVNYMDSIAGQISYLNREADPSQFAQPIFAEIVVPISLIESVDESVDLGDLKKDLAELLLEKQQLENEIIPHLQGQLALFAPAEASKIKDCHETFTGKPKDLKECIKRVTAKYKEGYKLEERNLREAIKRVEKIEKSLSKVEKKAVTVTKKLKKTGLSSLTQEAQLETRCKIGI
jgi:superfamily II DNA or RNA helicase